MLTEILEKMYNRNDVMLRIAESSRTGQLIEWITQGVKQHPPLKEFIEGLIKRTAEKEGVDPIEYLKNVRINKGNKLEDDQLTRVARIIGDEAKKTDPVAEIGKRFGVEIPSDEKAALMLELHSKQIVPRADILKQGNASYDAVAASLRVLMNDPATDTAGRRLLGEINLAVRTGSFKSADEAIIGVFKNDKFRMAFLNEFGPKSQELLERFANAGSIADLAAITSRVRYSGLTLGAAIYAPPETQKFIQLLQKLSVYSELHQQMGAVKVFEQSLYDIRQAVLTGIRDRGAFARGFGPAAAERAKGAGWGLVGAGKVVLTPVIAPGAEALEEFGEARVKGVKPRRIGRGVAWSAVTLAAAGAMVWIGSGIYGWFTKGDEEIREQLSKQWGVPLSKDTFKRMRSSELATTFFSTRLRYAFPPNVLKANSEQQVLGMFAHEGLYINPYRLDAIASGIERLIAQRKKEKKSDDQIMTEINRLIKTEWKKPEVGYFVNKGGLFSEYFCSQLRIIDRDFINMLKKNPETFVLTWAAIQDGSISRTDAVRFARSLYINDAWRTKLTDVVVERFKAATIPTVRDSLISAGIAPSMILEHPIKSGSFMEFYDQNAVRWPEYYKTHFRQTLALYQANENARKTLNSVALAPDEFVYGNISEFVNALMNDPAFLKTAKEKHIIANLVFARLGIYGVTEEHRNFIDFAYKHSDPTGKGSAGFMKWLISSGKRIRNAEAILKNVYSDATLFEGQPLDQVVKIMEDAKRISWYRKKGWFWSLPTRELKTPLPTERDIIPMVIIAPAPAEKPAPVTAAKPKIEQMIKAVLNEKPEVRPARGRRPARIGRPIIEEVSPAIGPGKKFKTREDFEARVSELFRGMASNYKKDNKVKNRLDKGGVKISEKGEITVPEKTAKQYKDFRDLARSIAIELAEIKPKPASRPARKPAGAETIDLE
jgi:hypothetical protein